MPTNTTFQKLLGIFFKAISECYPDKNINICQPETDCWYFGDNLQELYLYATATEDTVNLYATDTEEIRLCGYPTRTLNTAIGTIIIAEDF